MTADDHAETDAITWNAGYFISFSSNTFTNINGRKHIMKHKNMTNIMIVNRKSFLFRKNFILLLFGLAVSNLFNFACCLRTVLNIHEYDRIMMKHGNKNPTRKMNVFGDFPSFLSIVHENVFGSEPSSPHKPVSGKNWNEKKIKRI